MINITIPIIPITKKNSQQIMINKRTHRPFIMPSAKYKKYEKDCEPFMPILECPIDYPVVVECKYYMPTHRKCDLTNLLEATDDILVKYNILADDNYSIIASHDFSRVFYDKLNPRTEIKIYKLNEKESI